MNWDYAAGFIDADGSVGFFREYKRQSVALTASQITRPVLEELRELIGLGQVYERPSERKGNMNTSKVLYIYRASGFKLLPPLKELAPRMIVKKQKCLEVIQFIEARPKLHLTPNEREEAIRLHSEGMSMTDIAHKFDKSIAGISTMLKRHRDQRGT